MCPKECLKLDISIRHLLSQKFAPWIFVDNLKLHQKSGRFATSGSLIALFVFCHHFFCDGVDGGGGIGDSCCWILKDIAKGKVYLQKGFPSKLGPQNHFQSIALMFIKFVLNTSNCGRVHLAGSPKLQQRVGNCQASYQCTKGHWPHRKGLEIPVTEKVS